MDRPLQCTAGGIQRVDAGLRAIDRRDLVGTEQLAGIEAGRLVDGDIADRRVDARAVACHAPVDAAERAALAKTSRPVPPPAVRVQRIDDAVLRAGDAGAPTTRPLHAPPCAPPLGAGAA